MTWRCHVAKGRLEGGWTKRVTRPFPFLLNTILKPKTPGLTMASLERHSPAGHHRKACVLCKARQPRDGKFLSCLHIVCTGCLKECTSRDGCVYCSICRTVTTAQCAGVWLGKQLVDSTPFLTRDETSSAGDSNSRASADVLCCDPCNDNDVEKEASHECEDCDGLPLCDSHAEKHLKKRAYCGHQLRDRSGQIACTMHAPAAASKRCMRHIKHNVVTYCQTCCQCVCAECIAAGGHEGHAMESLASAADRQRSLLAEVYNTAYLGPNASAAAAATAAAAVAAAAVATNNTDDNHGGLSATAEELLKAVKNDIIMVNKEAYVASMMATKTFDKIEEMVKLERERILHEIDHRLWMQLDPLEAKKQRLDSLFHRQTTAVELATLLTSSAISHEGVLQICGTVVENLLVISKDLQAERNSVRPCYMFTREAPSNNLRDCLQVVEIGDGKRMDIFRSVLEAPREELVVGHEGYIVMKLADDEGQSMPSDQPLPEVSAAILLPSGKTQALHLCSDKSNSSTLVFPLSATEPGSMTMEVTYYGESYRSGIRVSAGVSFDPLKCHKDIVLSSYNRVATLNHGATANVLASEGYTDGRHEWSVKVIKGTVNGHGLAAGVTSKPSHGNYSSTDGFFGRKATGQCFWNTHGTAYQFQPHAAAQQNCAKSSRMGKVHDGDLLTFTLDCDVHTLQCVNKRTSEAKTMTGIDCTQPLYPDVSMIEPGQRVEICGKSP